MIELSIQGGNAKQRQLVEKAIKFCINLMLPATRSLHINVELKKQDGVSLLPGDYGSVVNISVIKCSTLIRSIALKIAGDLIIFIIVEYNFDMSLLLAPNNALY